jgi:hypothetical protein
VACGEPGRRRGVQPGSSRGAVPEDVLSVWPGVARGSSPLGSVPGVSGAAPTGAQAVSEPPHGRILAVIKRAGWVRSERAGRRVVFTGAQTHVLPAPLLAVDESVSVEFPRVTTIRVGAG